MTDRYTKVPSEQIKDDSINQSDLNITNTPTDGQILKINMPAGDFTAIDAGTGSGDMLKAVYDTDDDNIVDKAEELNDGSSGGGNAVTASEARSHIDDTNNPHSVTKTQVGLSNVDNLQQIPLSYLDTDDTLSADSDTKVPSQQAVKAYIDDLRSDHINLIEKNQINIALNAFRDQINNALTYENYVDSIVDEYEDESGIDTGSSSNQVYDSSNDLYSPSSVSGSYAQYKMNETSGTTVTDTGSGTNDGTASVDISNLTITGKINNAFDFNGSSEYINIDLLQADIASDTSGSFSVWFNTDTLTSLQQIFGFASTTSQGEITASLNSSGNIIISVRDNSGTLQWRHTSVASLSAGTWYHLVIVQNGTSPKVYVNNSDVTNLTTTTDTTFWFNDITNIDNGRIGCFNINNGGNSTFFDGQIDDFRYYQNYALDTGEISTLYNSGNGTETNGATNNMILISDSFPAQTQADSARIVIFEEDVDTITLNTDLLAYISRDGGSTFTQVTLSDVGNYETGKQILTDAIDISGQPSGTNMVYKLVTANNKDLKIHGTSLIWN